MLSKLAVVVGLAIGVQSSPLGRYARVINERQLAKDTTYDFIIAGGGIAGLTVADRLTENPKGILLQSYPSYSNISNKLIMNFSIRLGHRVWAVRPTRGRCYGAWCLFPCTLPLAAAIQHSSDSA